jgi:hypothetical protein
MHSSVKLPLAIASASTTPAAAPGGDRRSVESPLAIRLRLESRAGRELRAYFAAGGSIASANGASPAVKAVLDAIPAHHRGALGLHYRARFWSDAVNSALGEDAGVAIRLYCAEHPAAGPTPVLEQAAADRIAAIFAAEGVESWTLQKLCDRAHAIHADAVSAYAKVLAEREGNEVVPGDDQDDDRYDRDEDGGDDAFGASNDNGDVP